MSYNVVPTVANGDSWSAAQHNTYIKNNFAAVWPYTTIGDIAYATASNTLGRLGIGGLGAILRSTGSAPAWVASPATRSILQHNATNPSWLATGSALQMLRVNAAANAFEWFSQTAIGAHVARVAAQSISNNALTAISFDTELWDSSSVWTVTTPTKLFIPTTGKYLVTGTIGWDINNTGYRECRIRHNGATYLSYVNCSPVTGVVTRQNITLPPHQFTAGDYLEMEGYQNSGGNLNVNASEERLSILFLGA